MEEAGILRVFMMMIYPGYEGQQNIKERSIVPFDSSLPPQKWNKRQIGKTKSNSLQLFIHVEKEWKKTIVL
jgi:hypothetical protein